MRVDKAIKLAGAGEVDLDMVEVIVDRTNWTAGNDGYYYYHSALKPGETTAPIFSEVTFNADMGNEYQNATATVDVVAQAVQMANNGKTVMEAVGWPKA